MEQIDNIDIYEVDKIDYESYFYRLPQNELMKTTPSKGLLVYIDITTQEQICGILSEEIMGMVANRYFIFNYMDESRLGPEKAFKHIVLEEEKYKELVEKLCKEKDNG